eukprot:TRINITY_DN3693_c0_g1_i1.p1 TRINITY_DN3693_c0_g1~~TRINITY_DN3693_c0_g1_i1.p1  ORF type:complete len:351 (+),score=102.28 TRINITY_DN3693_c0_g1_i1:96-1148(+)
MTVHLLDRVLEFCWGLFCLGLLGFLLFTVYPLVLCYYVFGQHLYDVLVDSFPFMRVSRLKNKAVLITGCDSGFGFAAAEKLDKLGFSVFANCLTDDGAKNLAIRCSSRLVTLVFDVTKTLELESAYTQVEKELKNRNISGLHALVNNAGVAGGLFVEATSIEEYKRVLDVNFFAVVEVTRTFLPLIRKASPDARVINLSSMAGRFAPIGFSAYSASKFAVEAFSDALRREMIPFDVSVCIIEPGFFKTNIVKHAAAQVWDRYEKYTPRSVRASYGEAYAQWITKQLEDGFKNAEDPSVVSSAIVRSVYSKWPAIRLPLGKTARWLEYFFTFVPGGILDIQARLLGPKVFG